VTPRRTPATVATYDDLPVSEPEATIRDVLLTEPGSRVEGPTEDVLRVVFWTTLGLLGDKGIPESTADAIGLQLLARIHDQLAQHGLVIRDYAGQ
jgi:hypothetical protein